MVLDVLLGEDRSSGGHVPDQWDGNRVSALLVVGGLLDELDGARLAGITSDQPTALQLVQVVVDGRARGEPHGFPDLPDAGRIAPHPRHLSDVVQDLGLAVGQLLFAQVLLPRLLHSLLRRSRATSKS